MSQEVSYAKSVLFSLFEINFDFNINLKENILIYPKYSEDFKNLLLIFKNLPATIFSSHYLESNLPKNTFLSNLFDYLLNDQISSLSSNEIKTTIEEFVKNKCHVYSLEEIFSSFILLLYIFLQENVYGPSFFYIKETEKIDFHKRLELEFNNTLLFRIIKKFKDEDFIEPLSIGGESPYKKTKFVFFFFIVYNIIVESTIFQNILISKLWKARCLFLRNKLLPESIFSIRQEGFSYLNSFIEEFKIYLSPIELGLIYLEKASYCLKFYKYKENRELLDEVKELFNIKLNLIGVKAKRTKYQEESTVQLILQNIKEDGINEIDEIIEETKDEENDKEEIEKEKLIYHQNVKLDQVNDQNYILEKIKINEEDKKQNDYMVNIYDQLYVSSLLTEYKKSFPDIDLLREEIKAYTSKCLSTSFNWLVFSKLLIHRSFNEDKSSKTIERSLLQIQSICDQHNDRDPSPFDRSIFVFACDYPFIWNNKRKYAEMFMGYGSTMTAFEIFKEIDMWDEAISCLYLADKTQRARELSEERLKINPEPSILCVMGDILKDPKYYIEALTLSNGKFIKAYRCLGYYYFGINQYDKAIESFEKALEVNPLFPKIWFTLGCLYLSFKKYEDAIRSFNQSLSFDEDNAEGWGNLGICFSQVGKFNQSLKCLEEGFKKNRKNWKILENIIIISVRAKNLNKLLFAIENMINIDMANRITSQILAKMIDIFISSDFSQMKDYDISYYRKKIIKVFEDYTSLDGLNPKVWDLYILFIEKIELIINKNLTENINKQCVYYKHILDLRLKQMRNYTIVDWDRNYSNLDSIQCVSNKIDEELTKFNDILNNKSIDRDIIKYKEYVEFYNHTKSYITSIYEKIDDFKIKNKAELDK